MSQFGEALLRDAGGSAEFANLAAAAAAALRVCAGASSHESNDGGPTVTPKPANRDI